MSPSSRGRGGFALLPVVLALSLVGAAAYLMTRSGASGVALVASAQQADRARYVAEAALGHALWQVWSAGCEGYSDVADKAFGDDHYSAMVTPTGGSPITLAATGTLADGTTHTLVRSGERVYETPTVEFLQLSGTSGKDAILSDFYDTRNYGGASYLEIQSAPDWIERLLLQFDLSGLPAGVEVISARLELKQWSVNQSGVATVHRVTRDWVEGTRNGGGIADGANWPTFDATNAWTQAGGDFDPEPASEALVTSATNSNWMVWEVADLVEGWLADSASNHGMLLQGDGQLTGAQFASRETNNPLDAPRLTVVYTCECGQVCGGGAPGQNLLLVVPDASNLSSKESAGKALMESWGHTVATINASASQEDYATALTDVDAVYIAGSISSNDLGTKLTAATVGVVSEDAGLVDELGIAEPLFINRNTQDIEILDNTHYVTSGLSIGDLAIFSASQAVWTVGGALAPGLQVLGETKVSGTGFPPGVAVLETGAALYGGGFAAGRRVQVPWSIGSAFDYDALTVDGLDIMKRSIEWAADAACDSTTPLLLVVSDSAAPTAQEVARQTLLESWCYAVTRIDDDATSLEFATALPLNEVIYISQEITTLSVVTKLVDAPIGIVNEEYLISSDLGIGSGTGSGFYNDIDVMDDTHYITSGFGLGALALFDPPYDIYTGTGFTLAPDLQVLGETGSITGLAALDTGGALWDSGTAAGRRVLVPWGDDFSALNGDGQTLMQRAIEWAAGAGCGSPRPALLVVGDATLPLSSMDAGRAELIEGVCFAVSVIDDSDSQTNFNAAVDAADVVYVSGTVSGPSLLDKLTGITKGVVNEINGKLDNFGFSSSTAATLTADTFADSDAAHYVTSPFGGDAIGVFGTSLSMPVPSGTLAPGLHVAAGVTASDPALVILDTGAERWDGDFAPARRVHLPFTSAETTQMTPDGQTLLQRAVEWAAGAGGSAAPIAHWKLDETSGATAIDSEGGHHGTLPNGNSWDAGFVDGGLSLDGFNDYIDVPHDESLSLTGGMTFAAWGKPLDTSAGYQAILSKDIAGNGASNYWFGIWNDELVFGFWGAGSFQEVKTSGSGLQPGTWHHLAASFDNATDVVRLYVAGTEVHVGAITAEPTTETADLWLGNSVDNEYWDGVLDDVRIYDLPLSGTEISDLFVAAGGGAGGVVFEEFSEGRMSAPGGESVAIPKPSGTEPGDLLIVAVATDGDTVSTLGPSASWSLTQFGLGTGHDGSGAVTFGVWWKIADGTEPASLVYDWTGSEHAYGWIMRFTGHDPSSPFATSAATTGNDPNPLSTNLITGAGGNLILRLGGFDDDDVTLDVPGLPGHTAITMDGSGTGNLNTVSGGAGYTTQATAGDTGTSNFDLTKKEQYRTITIAIRPAP